MADPKKSQDKESFIGHPDRPEIKLNPDDLITNLRVRDLAALLGLGEKSLIQEGGRGGSKGSIKDFDYDPKHYLKEARDYKYDKDAIFDHPYPPRGFGGPDPALRQTVDVLVTEVAQLREAINQLRR
jgi:hypothetical protein